MIRPNSGVVNVCTLWNFQQTVQCLMHTTEIASNCLYTNRLKFSLVKCKYLLKNICSTYIRLHHSHRFHYSVYPIFVVVVVVDVITINEKRNKINTTHRAAKKSWPRRTNEKYKKKNISKYDQNSYQKAHKPTA